MVMDSWPKNRWPRDCLPDCTVANSTGITWSSKRATIQRRGRTNLSSKLAQCMDLPKERPVMKDGKVAFNTSSACNPFVVVVA